MPNALRHASAIAALLAAGALPSAAQLPSASAAALGVGDNFTARARGFAAVSWNPAGLGMLENPRWSFTLLPVRGIGGLEPIGYGDLTERGGELLSPEVKEEWLRRVTERGRERGSAGGEVTYLAFNAGRVGFQLSTRVEALLNLPPDGMELLLFGNAGRTGEPRDLQLAGARVDGAATSTAALSYAHPFKVGESPGDRLAVGATVKYTVGHAFVRGRDAGTALRADPLDVRIAFPLVQSDTSYDDPAVGSGVGLDLGGLWQRGRWSYALAVQNVVQTFAWDEDALYYRRNEAFFDIDTSETNFDPLPFDSLGAGALRDEVTGFRFRPVLSAGAAVRLGRTTLSADVRQRLADGFGAEAESHVGVGAEFRPVDWAPLRLGGAVLTGGYQIGGGIGIEAGPFNLAASAARRDTDELGRGVIGMLGVSFGGR